MSGLDFLYKLKITALLHDPPHKPWVLERHEEEAKNIISEIFGREFADEWYGKDEVRLADQLASSFDRWLISAIIGSARGVYRTEEVKLKEVKLKNCLTILSESVEGIPKPFGERRIGEAKDVSHFCKELHDLVRRTDDWQLKYHLTYAFYELIWHKYNKEVTCPADTRVPSHSVFDHVYASATVSNLISFSKSKQHVREKIEGYIVRIDLAGVQKFISASRKVRDLWISSWFASAFVWSLIKDLVLKYGPDILIKPTARNNPFYYHSLLSMLNESKDKVYGLQEFIRSIRNNYESLIQEWSGYSIKDGVPKAAVIPSSVDLILPLMAGQDIEDLGEKYHKIWERVVEVAENSFNDFLERLQKVGAKYLKLRSKLIEAFKNLKEIGFHQQPPLTLRITTVKLECFHEDGGRWRIKLDGEEIPNSSCKQHQMYDEIFRAFCNKAEEASIVKVDPAIGLKLTEWTSQRYKMGKWAFCTCCGKLPAVLEILHDESEDEGSIPPQLTTYFSMGEKFCGWCLIKRIMSLNEVFAEVAKELIGKSLGDIKLPIVSYSTADIATAPFVHKLEMFAKEKDISELSKLAGYCKEAFKESSVAKLFKERREEDVENLSNIEVIKFYSNPSEFGGSREDLMLEKPVLSYTRKIAEIIRQEHGRAEFTPYYALVRADGDNLGKLLLGRITEATGIKIYDWIEGIAEGPIKEVIIKLIKRAKGELSDEKWTKLIEDVAKDTRREEKKDEVKNELEGLCEELRSLADRGRILTSPSYHAMISRALMVQSIVDSERLDKESGIMVYSGGDDLLAMLPIRDAISYTYDTRKFFTHGFVSKESNTGFFIKCGALIPSLGLVGRSYHIFMVHYRAPLSTAVSSSREILEEKKNVRTIYGEKDWNKHVCFITYQPRSGALITSVLPLKCLDPELNPSRFLEVLDELIKLIWEEWKVTRSFPYDIMNNEVILNKLAHDPDLMEKYIYELTCRNLALRGKVKAIEHEEDIAKQICNSLRGAFKLKMRFEGKEESLIVNLAKALAAVISARGE